MTEPLIAYSLSNFREIIMGCLEASGACAIAEIGSEYGAFTEELCEFAARAGGGGMQYVILAGRGSATAPPANKEIRQGEGRTDVAR